MDSLIPLRVLPVPMAMLLMIDTLVLSHVLLVMILGYLLSPPLTVNCFNLRVASASSRGCLNPHQLYGTIPGSLKGFVAACATTALAPFRGEL